MKDNGGKSSNKILIEAQKGSDYGSNFSRVAGSQHWTLNTIGNWKSFNTDLNNDGSYSSTNDKIHAGRFSDANEVTQIERTISGGSPTTLSFTYDKAGNLREQQLSASVKMRYTHDAWNRLVKVQQVNTSGGETVYNRGEYEYNGLFQRIVKRSCSNILDVTTPFITGDRTFNVVRQGQRKPDVDRSEMIARGGSYSKLRMC